MKGKRSKLETLSRIPVFFAILIVKSYQWVISPAIHAIVGSGGGCRFHPTCSSYAITAYTTHGFIKGTLLTTWRILRCHPWGKSGDDPVPQNWKNAFKKNPITTKNNEGQT